GNGEGSFSRACEALFTGQMHTGAGLEVYPEAVPVEVGSAFITCLSIGPVAMANPCRIVSVLDEPLRAGFTYGTITGHVLSGEEDFAIELEAGGAVWLTITAGARPRASYARLGAPITVRAQSAMAKRYTQALQRAAGTPISDSPHD
ncbi:MAG: DUF1990 family protein, partial [Pseudonocardiaceae bacterium]